MKITKSAATSGLNPGNVSRQELARCTAIRLPAGRLIAGLTSPRARLGTIGDPVAVTNPVSDRPPRPREGGLVGNSIRLFTVAGIDVGVHVSWLLIFGLVTWSLATGYFPGAVPGIDDTEALVLGAVAAILLFASVLLHELAHSFVARAQGLDARSITLFIFGGVSNLGGEAKRPSTEFLVAIVGPLSSFAIAAVAFVVAERIDRSSPAHATAAYLAIVNALLGAFNLIPGFPLDGGRVFRAIVWTVTGSIRRATEIASGVGQLVAYGFLAWGFVRVLNGDVFGGIWVAAIGWFLQNAAHASLQQVVLEQRLRHIRVGDVIRPDPTAVPPGASVAEVIERVILRGNRRAVPVALDGRPIGILTLADIREIPEERRATTSVAEIMGGRERLLTIGPNDLLSTALSRLGEGDYEQLPVVADGQLVGMLTRADVVRQVQLREELGVGKH
jgi:Zn-dependent protease/CBS domain-containing protein